MKIYFTLVALIASALMVLAATVTEIGAVAKITFIGTTNYSATGSEGLIIGLGTNQLVTIPDAASMTQTNSGVITGRMLSFYSATNNGSLIITNYNGSQTILSGLSVTVPATNRLSIVSWQGGW